MKALRLPLYVFTLFLASTAFSQSEARKPDAQKPVRAADQSAKEIVLIGEMHGTQEMPRFFGNLVTVAAREMNQRVGAGLELPSVLQPLIDNAVKNNVTADSFRRQLLADPDWQKFAKIQDGRSSQAMLDLISYLLTLAESQKISFFFFDTQTNERNETMAQVIAQRVRQQGNNVTYILAGNIHANKAPRYPFMKKTLIVPMGYRLEEQGFTVHSYDLRYSAGDAWYCGSSTDGCGVHHLEGYSLGEDHEGYDGVLFVGPLHASLPAHDSGPAKDAD